MGEILREAYSSAKCRKKAEKGRNLGPTQWETFRK
jgi:hypothetical protein